MSAVRAIEDACGVTIDEGPIRDLRRLLYCGEWIESHACTSTCSTRPTSSATPAPSRWRATIAEVVERGLRMKKAGNALIDARRRARDPPGQRPRRRLLPRPDARRAAARCVEPLRARARDGARDRRAGPPRSTSPTSSCAPELVALSRARRATRSTAGAIVSDRRPGHRRPRSSTSTSSRSRSRTPTRCTPAFASAAATWPGRWRASRSPSGALRPLAREAAARGRARAGLPQPVQEHRRPRRRARARLRRGARADRRLRAAGRAGRRGRAARAASATARPRRRAACSTTATSSTRTARSSTPGSSRRRRRTSRRSRRTCAPSSSARLDLADDAARAAAASRRSATTTRASRARPTSWT